jgi:hypothetical protein
LIWAWRLLRFFLKSNIAPLFCDPPQGGILKIPKVPSMCDQPGTPGPIDPRKGHVERAQIAGEAQVHQFTTEVNINA